MKKIFFLCSCLFLMTVTACDINRETKEPSSGKLESIEKSEGLEEPEAEDWMKEEPENHEKAETDAYLINTDGQTVKERFGVPQGFTRVEPEQESFGAYLQNLPLKPDGTKVKYYDGREKQRDVYLGVLDFSLGERDLQQCADAIMRLRAEYLYAKERYDEIHFNFVNGFCAEFSKWAAGNSISINGNNVSWTNNSNNNSSYESLQKYLDVVYAYASTLSLEKELAAKPFSELAIGDVFIQGGSPGHCVIVVDMAVNEDTGEKIFMLAQSYMPAQDIQILKGDRNDSPWYSAEIENTLDTPEWVFEISDLKTW